jgi:hypothetical protein
MRVNNITTTAMWKSGAQGRGRERVIQHVHLGGLRLGPAVEELWQSPLLNVVDLVGLEPLRRGRVDDRRLMTRANVSIDAHSACGAGEGEGKWYVGGERGQRR